MNELKGKGLFLVLGVIVLLVFVSRRGGGGGEAAPAQYAVSQGIDTAYEQLKFGAEISKAEIAGKAFSDMLDAETAQAKFASDEHLADIEGGYAARMAEAGYASAERIASVGYATAERINASTQMGENYRTGVQASAASNISRDQRAAAVSASRWGALGDFANGLFGWLG
jgi:hypothetical protein